MAARGGDHDKVKELVKKGADVNVKDIRSGVRILDYIQLVYLSFSFRHSYMHLQNLHP